MTKKWFEASSVPAINSTLKDYLPSAISDKSLSSEEARNLQKMFLDDSWKISKEARVQWRDLSFDIRKKFQETLWFKWKEADWAIWDKTINALKNLASSAENTPNAQAVQPPTSLLPDSTVDLWASKWVPTWNTELVREVSTSVPESQPTYSVDESKLNSEISFLESLIEEVTDGWELSDDDKERLKSIREYVSVNLHSIKGNSLVDKIKTLLASPKLQITKDYEEEGVKHFSASLEKPSWQQVWERESILNREEVRKTQVDSLDDLIVYLSDLDWNFVSERRNDKSTWLWRTFLGSRDEHKFIVWEAQFREEFRKYVKTWESFYSLLSSFWITEVNWKSINSFQDIVNNINADTFEQVQAWKDFWSALRERLKIEIFRRIESWATLSTILTWKSTDMIVEQLKTQWKFLETQSLSKEQIQKINSVIDRNAKVQEILSKLPDWVDKWSILSAIRYEWLTFVAWNVMWAWVNLSVDPLSLLARFIDNITVWTVNWIPWIILSKNVYENGWTKVDVWVATFIPFVTVSQELYSWEVKWIDREVEWKVALTWALNLTPKTLSLMLWVESNVEKWILEKTSNFDRVMSKVVSDLLVWKAFSADEYSSIEWVTEKDLVEIEQLYRTISLFYAEWSKLNPEQKKFLLDSIKTWSVTEYRNSLYSKASWLNFEWIWIWIVLPMLLPLIWVKFRYISTEIKWDYSKTFAEHKVTERNNTLSNIWWRIEEIWWKKVLFFEWLSTDNISAPAWVQVFKAENWVYIWWNVWNNISSTEMSTLDGKATILIIGWVKMANWTEISFDRSFQIVSSIEELTSVWLTYSVKETKTTKEYTSWEDLEEIKWIKSVLDTISDVIDRRASNRVWDLQSKVSSLLNWNANLDDVWNYFINDLLWKNKPLSSYFFTKIWQGWLDEFRASLKKVDSPIQKRYILEKINSSLMWDVYILDKAWKTDAEHSLRKISLESDLSKWWISLNSTDYPYTYNWKSYRWLDLQVLLNSEWKQDLWLKVWEHYYMSMDLEKFDLSRKEAFSKVASEYFWVTVNSSHWDWLRSRFKWQPNFETTTLSNMISFPVSSQINYDKSWRAIPWYRWVAPIMWATEVAMPKSWDAFVNVNDDISLKDAIIDRLPKDFLTKLKKSLNLNSSTDEDIKKLFKNGSIEFDVVMFKWWKCFNDSYWLRLKTVTTTTWEKHDLVVTSNDISVPWLQKNSSTAFNFLYVGESLKDDDKKWWSNWNNGDWNNWWSTTWWTWSSTDPWSWWWTVVP